ncbi:MAG TPA: hypothetical protein VIQ31_18165, partial [Phormidium sp.]
MNRDNPKKGNNQEKNIASPSPSEPKQVPHTIDIDGKRPIAPDNIQIEDTLDVDGHRPITSSNLQFEDTLDVDGHRPI